MGTRYFAETGASSEPIYVTDARAIDWNYDGDYADVDVRANINGNDEYEVLTGQNDWRSLIYTGGAIGKPGVEVLLPTETTADELTEEENDAIPRLLRQVEIDIKPGSYPNSINPGSHGVVPVAVLTTDESDASTLDPVTVVFAGAVPLRWAMEDVDSDGDLDLIFHFKIQELNLYADSTDAALTGQTFDEVPVEGTDTVNIVP